MPFPKPRPLQSRLLASLVTSITVFILYLSFFSSHSAYASDVDPTSLEDYSREKLIDSHIIDDEFDIDIRQASYEADFFGADRGIIGRADTGPQYIELLNNAPQRIEVKPGGTVYFSVQNVTLMGNTSQGQVGLPSPVRLLLRTENRREEILKVPDSSGSGLPEIHNEVGTTNPILHSRQDGPATLYISLNTCQQPSDPTDISGTKGAPPQPQIYISQSSSNTLPGPGQSADSQQQVPVVGGFANVTLQASGPVYIGIAAPNTTTFTEGSYLVEIAASVDALFHSYLSTNLTLHLIDSDTTSALLVTSDLTNTTNGTLFDEWMSLYPPFSIFVVNANKTTIEGVQNSYCGLKTYADIAGVQGGPRSDDVESSVTNLTGSPYPKQQFYVQGLNGSSSYYGILAMTGNSTNSGAGVVGGGGEIMQSVTFPTQAGRCCYVSFAELCR
jgi:calcium channel MID1